MIIVFGTGKHAKVVNEVAKGEMHDFGADFSSKPGFSFIVGVGCNLLRREIYLLNAGFGIPCPVIHNDASISRSSRVWGGTFVAPMAVIGVEAEVGWNCIINTACSVDHHCKIGDHCHIAPGARLCGSVRVGDGVLIGAGAVILPEVTIGPYAVIGAGSVIRKHVEPGEVVKGAQWIH